MLSEKEIKLIKSYYIRLSLAMPSLAGAFLPAVPFLLCNLLNYILGDGVSIGDWIWIYPIAAALCVVVFAYGMLSVRFGMMTKKWKAILEKMQNTQMNELDSSKASMANATRAMGNLTGSASMQVAGGIETVQAASEYSSSMLGNINKVADTFQVKLPKVGFYQFMCIFLSSILVTGSYIPVLIGSYHEGNETIARREAVFEKYSQAFQDMDYGLNLADDKNSKEISFTFSDKQNRSKYISIDGNRYGEFEGVHIIYPMDINKSVKENFDEYRNFIKEMEQKLKSSDTDLKELQDKDFVQLFNVVASEYESKEKNEDGYVSEEVDSIKISLSSRVNDAYYYFSINLD